MEDASRIGKTPPNIWFYIIHVHVHLNDKSLVSWKWQLWALLMYFPIVQTTTEILVFLKTEVTFHSNFCSFNERQNLSKNFTF